MNERLKKMIEEEIERKFKRAPTKRKIARELLKLAEKGVKSPRGGLWTLWENTNHANSYRVYWYAHAREVLRRIPMLAVVLHVDLSRLGVDPSTLFPSTLLDEETLRLKRRLSMLMENLLAGGGVNA